MKNYKSTKVKANPSKHVTEFNFRDVDNLREAKISKLLTKLNKEEIKVKGKA